jgi:hypothetical protein
MKINKAKLGLMFTILTWPVLYCSFIVGIGDPHPNSPPIVYERKDIMFKMFFYTGALLFIASLILTTWGIKKNKIISIISYSIHAAVIALLMLE